MIIELETNSYINDNKTKSSHTNDNSTKNK